MPVCLLDMKNLYSSVSYGTRLLLIQCATLWRWLTLSQIAHCCFVLAGRDSKPLLLLLFVVYKQTVTTVRRGHCVPHKPNALHNVPSSVPSLVYLGVKCPSFHTPIFPDCFLDCAKVTLHFHILLGVKALCALTH